MTCPGSLQDVRDITQPTSWPPGPPYPPSSHTPGAAKPQPRFCGGIPWLREERAKDKHEDKKD